MTCLHFAILGLLGFQAPAGKVEVLNCWNVALATNQHTHPPAWLLPGLPGTSPGSGIVRDFILPTLITEPINLGFFCGKLMNKAVSSMLLRQRKSFPMHSIRGGTFCCLSIGSLLPSLPSAPQGSLWAWSWDIQQHHSFNRFTGSVSLYLPCINLICPLQGNFFTCNNCSF